MNNTVCQQAKHDAMKQDSSIWSTLPCIGVMVIETDETGPGYRLEMRNCSCGSTLAMELPLE